MLPDRFVCLISEPDAMAPALRFLTHIEQLKRIPIALLPWSGEAGYMVDETGMRRALDPQLAALIAELHLPVTWLMGDGDKWEDISVQLRPNDWLVVTVRVGAEDAAVEIAELLRRCPIPVLVIPHEPNPEGRGLLALYDSTAAGSRALQVAARVSERLGQPLNIMATASDADAEEMETTVERAMEHSYASWQLLLVQGGVVDDLARYTTVYGPALCVLGVEGGGAGGSTKFGPRPLEPMVRGLLEAATIPLLCVPEWGEPIPPRPVIGEKTLERPESGYAQA